MNKMLSLALAVFAAATLTACGGGGGGEPAPVAVAAADTTVPANGTTTAAVTNIPFTFPAGVPSFGTTSTTTVTFTNTSTTPAFSITSGGHTATGTTTFGSCHFQVALSDFPAGSPLATGKLANADPCTLKFSTAGEVADNLPHDSFASFWLGVALSAGSRVTVTISPSGTLTIDGLLLGTITIKLVTG
jgi:hypothetical protein